MLRGILCALVGLLISCGECEDDFDCPGQSVCTDAVCERVICTRDTACPPGQRCDGNACVPVRAAPASAGAPITIVLERDG